MANIKSQKKRILISRGENARNTSKKSAVKTAIKKYEAVIATGNVEVATKMLSEVFAVIDGAKSDGIFHVNTAANKKARLSKLLNTLTAPKAE